MAWRYSQATGLLEHSSDSVLWQRVWCGYSGHGVGLNNPDYQHVEAVGPIPVGRYTIGAPYDSQHTGPFTLPLTPAPGTQTFGRSAFRVHGDNRHLDKSASHGCLIFPLAIREQVHESCDTDLEVVSGREEQQP